MNITNVYELSTPSFRKAVKREGIDLLKNNMKLFAVVTPSYMRLSSPLSPIEKWMVIVCIPSVAKMLYFDFPKGNRKPSQKAISECVNIVSHMTNYKPKTVLIGNNKISISVHHVTKEDVYDYVYNRITKGKLAFVNDVVTKAINEKTVVYGFD
mgnify:CR=1 FL=1